MAQNSTPTFVMHGAKAAIGAGLTHIEEQVKGIELAVNENPGLAFDLAKTLIESVCRTVLTDRGIKCDPNDDLPKLFKTVTVTLPFLPPSASSQADVRKSLAITLGGLHTAVQGICELRNQCGFASHGSGAPRPAMESVQALLAASTADAIVGFLHRVHMQDRTPPPSPLAAYQNNQDFNTYVDDFHPLVTIFESEFRPSEILFQMEPETYRLALAEFEQQEAADANDTGDVA